VTVNALQMISEIVKEYVPVREREDKKTTKLHTSFIHVISYYELFNPVQFCMSMSIAQLSTMLHCCPGSHPKTSMLQVHA